MQWTYVNTLDTKSSTFCVRGIDIGPEELKLQDQMEWVRRMNNIQATAEEIAYKNIIFM